MSGRRYRSEYNEFRGRQRGNGNWRGVESDQPTTSGEGGYGGRFRGRGRGRGRSGGGRGGGPPPGLTGKEIGLWYRQRSIQKNKETKSTSLAVNLDPRIQRHIQDVLYSIDTPYLCPSPQRSDVARGFRPHQSRGCFAQDEESSDDEDDLKLIEYNYLKQEKRTGGGGLDGCGESVASKYRHIAESKFKHKFLQNITGSIESNLANSLSMSVLLDRDVALDDRLKAELLNKENSRQYQTMLAFRKKLPAFEKKNEILKLIHKNQTILISGETGCGKTTQVAQFILDDFITKGDGSVCHVVCTQPRRISAISVAERVAQERDECCGSASVGYQIRLEAKLPRQKGSILYCTTGMLLQFMRSDPGLRMVSHLILDEIHERDVISDFVITILKDVLPKRPDLKLILMSATLNAEHFSEYYNYCPSINIPGFTYPVKQYYLEDVLELTKGFKPVESQEPKGWRKHLRHSKIKMKEMDEYKDFIEPYVRHLKSQGKYSDHVLMSLRNPESEHVNVDLIEALIYHICRNEGDGAILVFLPGWSDISKLHSLLMERNRYNSDQYVIIPLHSLMPTTTQKSVFDKPPPGVRKIVLATNIAETSITIDDVVFVVDCGKIKMKNFDAENNIATLKAEWVSLANSKQRKGRAGRVQPGICYHLYSKAREMLLADYPLPEMLRTRLEEVILQMKILQLGQVKPFLERVMNPPDSKVIELSLKLLRTLNALDENEHLTPLGYHLANLPLDPQIGKMILMGAIFSCIDPVFSIAASLSFKDPFVVPLGAEDRVNAKKIQLSNGVVSDHLIVAEAMKRWEAADRNGNGRRFCWDYFLSSNTMCMLRDMKRQFAQYMHEMNFLTSSNVKDHSGNINSDNIGLVKAIICSGLYPNVAVIRKMKRNRRTGMMKMMLHTPEDGTVELHPKCVADKISECESPFLLYHMKLKSSAVFLHDASVVNPLPLLFFAETLRTFIDWDCEIIIINEAIHFRCPKQTALLVKDVRERLNGLLEHKITHPGVINWSVRSDEGNLLRAIIELITYEDKKMRLMAEDGDNEFSD